VAAMDLTPIRVVLVDDEALVRSGLRLILEGDPALRVVGEAGDGRAGIDLVTANDLDVVLMDIRELLGERPELKIIVLTTFDTDEMVLTALRLGASGFLLKDTPPAELIDAVRQVASGRTALSQPVITQLIKAVTDRPEPERRSEAAARLEQLTARERDVAIAIARGLSNAEIAAAHFVSVTTVKTHVGRILDKLAVANRVQIAICVHSALN
jgi:DNA-binding NarL/FixJ family response regulator